MPDSGTLSLLYEFCRQSLWGKRGLLKSGVVWLPAALFLVLSPRAALGDLWRFAIGYFLAQYLFGLALNLGNDLTDRAEDLAAGKSRWVLSLSPSLGRLVVALAVALGFFTLTAFGAPPLTLLSYGIGLALGFAYSVRPLRFKERGLVGLTEYGACALFAHVAVPATWVGAPLPFLVLFALTTFVFAWVKLHFHQVVEYSGDEGSGVRTYTVQVGLGRARVVLQIAAKLGTALVLSIAGYLFWVLPPVEKGIVGLGLCAAVAAGGYAWLARRRRGPTDELPRELPFYYLGLIYAFWWVLPPLLLIRLACAEPTLASAAVLSVLTSIAGSLHFARYRTE